MKNENLKVIPRDYCICLLNNFHQKSAVWEKEWNELVYIQIELSAICRVMFRLSLNRPLPEITFLQYALEPILDFFFAGVVYGASITYCGIVHNGVIRRWQRLKCRWFHGLGMAAMDSYHPKPRMDLNLLTSIRFQKNLRTSPKKLTYDNGGCELVLLCKKSTVCRSGN